MVEISTFGLLLLIYAAAVEAITSIIVEGKITLPLRALIGRRAFPAEQPKGISVEHIKSYSQVLYYCFIGLWLAVLAYALWKVCKFLNALLSCTTCTGVWVSFLAASTMPQGVPGLSDLYAGFVVKSFAIAYLASCLEVFRKGRVHALDLELKPLTIRLEKDDVRSFREDEGEGLQEAVGEDLRSTDDSESRTHQGSDS